MAALTKSIYLTCLFMPTTIANKEATIAAFEAKYSVDQKGVELPDKLHGKIRQTAVRVLESRVKAQAQAINPEVSIADTAA